MLRNIVMSRNDAMKRQIPHRLLFIAIKVINYHLDNEGNYLMFPGKKGKNKKIAKQMFNFFHYLIRR